MDEAGRAGWRGWTRRWFGERVPPSAIAPTGGPVGSDDAENLLDETPGSNSPIEEAGRGGSPLVPGDIGSSDLTGPDDPLLHGDVPSMTMLVEREQFEPTVPDASQNDSLDHVFEARAFWAPKLGDDDSEWEDAYAIDERMGRAAVADGASEGIFSRAWAHLMTESLVLDRIDPTDRDAFRERLDRLRSAWLQVIDYPSRRYTQQAKIDQTGAAATLLVFQVEPAVPSAQSASTDDQAREEALEVERPWRAWAVGDSCLFQLRENRLLAAFPISAASEFGIAPALLRTKAATPVPDFRATAGTCRAGDVFLLATDAVAQRLLLDIDENSPIDAIRYMTLSQERWREEIDTLRRQRRIVNDDSTLLWIRILPSED